MSYFTLIFWAEAIGYAFLIVIILNLARIHISNIRRRSINRQAMIKEWRKKNQ